MKKLMTIAMVALLAVTSVFAGFSGEFKGAYTADFAGKAYGYGATNGFKLTFEGGTGATAHEKDVYANFAGSFSVKDLKANGSPAYEFKMTDASINGVDWKINLANAAAINSYANGFIGREDADGNAAAPSLDAEVKNAAGLTVTYKDYSVAGGLNYKAGTPAKAAEMGKHQVVLNQDKIEVEANKTGAVVTSAKNIVGGGYELVKADDKFAADFKVEDLRGKAKAGNYSDYKKVEDKWVPVDEATMYVATVEKNTVMSFDNWSTLEYEYVKTPAVEEVKAEKNAYAAFFLPTYKFLEDQLTVTGNVAAYATGVKTITLGFGTQVAFAQEDGVKASVGFDGVVAIADKTAFDFDIAANVAYAPVALDVYYASKAAFVDTAVAGAEKLLDVQVSTDLAAYDIPVSFAIAGSDLINDNRALDVEVAGEVVGLKATVNGGYNFGSKEWNTGLKLNYTLENVAAFEANVGLEGAKEVSKVSFGVSAENTTLIENATLKLAYASENFLAKDKAAGALTASVGIKF